MSRFVVIIPIAGTISIAVEAPDEKSAIATAWDEYHVNGADEFDLEWDAYQAITSGNVLHVPNNEVSVLVLKERKP